MPATLQDAQRTYEETEAFWIANASPRTAPLGNAQRSWAQP